MFIKLNSMDEIFHKTFKHAKQLAKEFYFGVWAKNPPRCQAFSGEMIHITREGWEHITHEEGKTKTDIMGRLFVLERVWCEKTSGRISRIPGL